MHNFHSVFSSQMERLLEDWTVAGHRFWTLRRSFRSFDLYCVENDVIDAFEITRSLSHKGCPYDNAVAEATYKIFKTEFVMNKTFDSLYQLRSELTDYVHWFNNYRIHGSLGYLSPVQFRSSNSAK